VLLDERHGLEAREAPGVAKVHLGKVLAGIAVASEDLDGAVGDLESHARCLEVRQGRGARGVFPLVEGPRGLPHEQARAVDLDRIGAPKV